jgi:hypothetical protein
MDLLPAGVNRRSQTFRSADFQGKRTFGGRCYSGSNGSPKSVNWNGRNPGTSTVESTNNQIKSAGNPPLGFRSAANLVVTVYHCERLPLSAES